MSRSHLHGLQALILAALAVLAVACTPSLRSMEPPVVRLSGLSVLDPQTAEVRVMITNLSPIALDPQSAQVVVLINDEAFIDWEQTVDWAVSANARDVVRFTATAPSPQVRQWLSQLSQGERENLPWSLEVAFVWPDEHMVEATAQGWLYPKPGQPGQYR